MLKKLLIAIALIACAALPFLGKECKRWESVSAMPAVAKFCAER